MKNYFKRFSMFMASFVGAIIALLLVTGVCYALIVSGTLTLQSGTAGTGIVFQTNGANTRGTINNAGSWNLQNGALATNAIDGFTYLPSSAGTPTGVPTAIAGGVPLELDTTNFFLYARLNGLWQIVGPLQAGTGISITNGVIAATGAGGSSPGWMNTECAALISNMSLTSTTATCWMEEISDNTNTGLGGNNTSSNAGTGATTGVNGIGVQATSGATASSNANVFRNNATAPANFATSGAKWGFSCYAAITTAIDSQSNVTIGIAATSVSTANNHAVVGVLGSAAITGGSNTFYSFENTSNGGASAIAQSTIAIDTAYHTFRQWYNGTNQKGQVDGETAVALTTNNPNQPTSWLLHAANGTTAAARTIILDHCIFAKAGGT